MTQSVFVIVCGINGAGKSTLADALARSPDLAGLPFLNPDELSAGYRVADPVLSRETADYGRWAISPGRSIHRLLARRQSPWPADSRFR